MELNEKLQEFIENQQWIFAKTYAKTWPHEYIVQERVDNDLYLELANHIDNFGYESYFYKTKQIYFEHNGFTYWHMENIINRCVIADTYHEVGHMREDIVSGNRRDSSHTKQKKAVGYENVYRKIKGFNQRVGNLHGNKDEKTGKYSETGQQKPTGYESK